MSLAFLGEEQLNEHEIAWRSRDWAAVKELAKQFKVPAERSLFDIIANVTQKTGHKPVECFAEYDQHNINLALSQHISMSGYASELNQMEGYISDQMHYDYLYFSVRTVTLPRIKFAKLSEDWEYKITIRMIARHFQVSIPRAQEYLSEFSEEQVAHLKKLFGPTITGPDSEFLKFLPNKTERTKMHSSIKSSW